MDETVRTFIAIELNRESQDIIKNAQDFMKRFDLNVKWVKPENAHLTLKFLGNVPLKKISHITKILGARLKGFGQIHFEITNIGAFPGIKRPKIFWIGTTDPGNKIKKLSSVIEEELLQLGFGKGEKTFHPHITIGRTKHSKIDPGISDKTNNFRFENFPNEANSIILFKSLLTPTGPIYEKITNISLR